ncbi:hypothetical protein ACFE04_002692 [Oxalis oulophora]
MECLGIMAEDSDSYWNNLNCIFSNEETENFMDNLLTSFPLIPDEGYGISYGRFNQYESIINEGFWRDVDNSSITSQPILIQESHDQQIQAMLLPSNDSTIDQYVGDHDDKRNNASQNLKKRSRPQGDHVEKNKKSKKRKNEDGKHKELSNCSSDDDSNNGSSKDIEANGKTRAGRGSATNPQSIYARNRRGRINERLKVLQNIVPNGTKVDISTMLEEAVQYVKFLQLQIKMLSSDDNWMYAPLAYNGMNLDLHNLNYD